MSKAHKPSAADRTVDMFAVPTTLASEVIEEGSKEGRVSLEEDADRLRQNAFTGQEWATKYFGTKEAWSDEFRVSLKDGHYLVETILKKPGDKTAYGYSGIMIREESLFSLVTVLVEAVRAKQKKEVK